MARNALSPRHELAPALAGRLRAESHDAIHVTDIGHGNLSDDDIFRRAVEDHRIVVTFDLDFGEIAGATKASGSGIVLLRLKRAGQTYLWDRLRTAIAVAGPALDDGAIVLVEDARIRVRRRRPDNEIAEP